MSTTNHGVPSTTASLGTGGVMHMLASLGRRALEGNHPWGTVDIAPAGRSGCSRFRVDVYAPGITHGERRALRFHRSWPITGLVLVALMLVVLGSEFPPTVVMVTSLAMYAAGWWASSLATRELRSRTHRVEATFITTGGRVEVFGQYDLFCATSHRLDELDRAARTGEITPAQYEALWAGVYNSVEDYEHHSRVR
jgi:hypothetical protein